MYVFSKIGSFVWSEQEINKAGSTYAFPFEEKDSELLQFGENEIVFSGIFNTNAQKDFSITEFKLGRGYAAFSSEMRLIPRKVELENEKYDYYAPIHLIFDERTSVLVPAFLAYEVVVRNAPESQQKEILKELTSVLLPELTLAKFKGLGLLKVPKIPIKGKTLFDVTKLKNLTPRVPSGKNLTNLKFDDFTQLLSKSEIEKLGKSFAQNLDDIIKNGDNSGEITEKIVSEVFRKQGFACRIKLLKKLDNILPWASTRIKSS